MAFGYHVVLTSILFSAGFLHTQRPGLSSTPHYGSSLALCIKLLVAPVHSSFENNWLLISPSQPHQFLAMTVGIAMRLRSPGPLLTPPTFAHLWALGSLIAIRPSSSASERYLLSSASSKRGRGIESDPQASTSFSSSPHILLYLHLSVRRLISPSPMRGVAMGASVYINRGSDARLHATPPTTTTSTARQRLIPYDPPAHCTSSRELDTSVG